MLDPEAYVSNQPSRGVLNQVRLRALIDPSRDSISSPQSSSSALGGIITHGEDEIIAHVPRGIISFTVSELTSDTPMPLWALQTDNTIRSLSVHEGSLWSASSQGLRRFDWPAQGAGLSGESEAVTGAVIDLNQQSALASLPGPLMGESTLITATPRQLNHLGTDSLRQLLITPDLNPQRVLVVERLSAE